MIDIIWIAISFTLYAARFAGLLLTWPEACSLCFAAIMKLYRSK